MSGPTIEDLLGIRPLTTLIQSFDETDNPQSKFFTSIFEKGEQTRPPGDGTRRPEAKNTVILPGTGTSGGALPSVLMSRLSRPVQSVGGAVT